MKIQSLSKSAIRKYKPKEDEIPLLISIQDFDKQILPFKERTNFITRRNYRDILFLYFDDYNKEDMDHNPYYPFAFQDNNADKIINFLDKHYEEKDFNKLLVHCEMGVSRSHAIALFAAKYYEKDETLYNELLNQEGKIYGGNDYIYEKLESAYEERNLTRNLKNNNLIL